MLLVGGKGAGAPDGRNSVPSGAFWPFFAPNGRKNPPSGALGCCKSEGERKVKDKGAKGKGQRRKEGERKARTVHRPVAGRIKVLASGRLS